MNTTYGIDDIGMAAFSVFFMQSPSFLAHQRRLAGRRWARVRFRGGDRLTLSPEECIARQLAYERQREQWRLFIEAEMRHASATPWEGHTAVFDFKVLS